jgi:phosphatidylinositol alpha 1,6-mannosyltransferase
MRILIVTETFAPATDAAAETARHVCDALIAAGHEVCVLAANAGKDSYRSADVVRTRKVFPVPTIRATVAEFTPDVVQILFPRTVGAAAMRALEHAGVPMFVLDPTPLQPRAGTALASSHATARVLGTASISTRVWAPGIHADEHHPGLRSDELHDAWARVSSPDGPRIVVGYAGPVGAATTKAVRRLVHVAGLDRVRLVVLGSGPGTSTLKQAGARIVGESSGLELARGIASLDLLVQARKHESGLTVVRKALASGVPVVAFDTAATAEVVTSGHNGVLVGPGRGRTGLRDTVAELVADPGLRAELAANARDSVIGRSWADAVDELVGIYHPLRPAV